MVATMARQWEPRREAAGDGCAHFVSLTIDVVAQHPVERAQALWPISLLFFGIHRDYRNGLGGSRSVTTEPASA